MPSSVTPEAEKATNPLDVGKSQLASPLVDSGLLNSFEWQDSTPVIGREFHDLQITRDLLQAPNSDELIRDFAATVSQRGVVFLKSQDATPEEMQQFGEKMSKFSGAPQSSTLHIHPVTAGGSELGDNVLVIKWPKRKQGQLANVAGDVSRLASAGWHSDITWEKAPSDYAMLKVHTVPKTGGDTVWASAYEVYDRLSPAVAAMLEGLTATHDGSIFLEQASRPFGNVNSALQSGAIRTEPRGSPLNAGSDLKAIHPVIRTNPVTGWKSVFVNKAFTKRINGVTKDESDMLLSYLANLVTQNHDLQVRYKWGKDDIAIWDNRSTFHNPTHDYLDDRVGDRVCSIGEVPFYDPASTSRRDALDQAA